MWNHCIGIALLALCVLAASDDVPRSVVEKVGVAAAVVENVGRLLRSLTLAYQVTSPEVLLTYNTGLSNYAKTQLFTNQVDYAVTALLPTAADLDAAPDLEVFPFLAQAVVPLWRIDGVDPNVKMVFSAPVLAGIYNCNITRWNDPRIRQLNPSLMLPNTRINVIGGIDGAGATLIFTNTLGKYDSDFAMKVPASSSPIWPSCVQRFNARTPNLVALSTLPNSIGFQWLDVAADYGFSTGRMVNTAGQVVDPTVSSARIGMMENVASPLEFAGGTLDVSNSAASGAWPMSGLTYLLVRKNTSRLTCAVRAAAVKFLLWVYSSRTASDIAAGLFYVPLPSFVLDAHNVLQSLQSGIFCKGVLAVSSGVVNSFSGGVAPPATRVVDSFTNVYWQDTAIEPDMTYDLGDVLMKQLVFNEIDFALVNPPLLNHAQLVHAQTANNIELLPLFVSSVALCHSLPLQANDPPLVLDMPTLGKIFLGQILTWSDPGITALNPKLASAGRLPSTNITLVAATSGDRYEQKVLVQALSAQGDGSFNYSTAGRDAAAPTLTDVPAFNRLGNVLRVSWQRMVPRAIMNTPGALSIVAADDSVNAGLFQASLLVGGQPVPLSSASVAACAAGTLDPRSLEVAPARPDRCWPLAVPVAAAVRKENTDCAATKKALTFVQYLQQTPDLPAVRGNILPNLIGAAWYSADVRAAVTDRLNAITCQGDTLLMTLPVLTKISAAVNTVGQGVQVVGYILCALVLVFVYVWRHRSAIKSASPFFLMPIAVGLFLMFRAGAWLIDPEPSDLTCSGAWWTGNLGWFLAFAPLFAKSWRIYKIFMRSEMTVLRITDLSLFVRVGVALGLELFILALVQSLSPIKMQERVQPSLPRDLLMRYCAPDSFALVICMAVVKGLILLFGVVMSFTTRGVSENFNESKSIAFSIYNQLFTVVIVALIGALQSGVLNIMMLMSFTIFWIALGSLVIVFAPKIARIYSTAVGFVPERYTDSKQRSGNGNSGTASKGGNAQLRSLKDFVGATVRMLDRNALRTYLNLLQREVAAATAALNTLNANETALFPQRNDMLKTENSAGGRGSSPEPVFGVASGSGGGTATIALSTVGSGGQRSDPSSRIGSPEFAAARLPVSTSAISFAGLQSPTATATAAGGGSLQRLTRSVSGGASAAVVAGAGRGVVRGGNASPVGSNRYLTMNGAGAGGARPMTTAAGGAGGAAPSSISINGGPVQLVLRQRGSPTHAMTVSAGPAVLAAAGSGIALFNSSSGTSAGAAAVPAATSLPPMTPAPPSSPERVGMAVSVEPPALPGTVPAPAAAVTVPATSTIASAAAAGPSRAIAINTTDAVPASASSPAIIIA